MDVSCRASCRARAKLNRKLSPRCFPYILILCLSICEVINSQEQFPSHDNIFRIQLWDGDAWSRSSHLSDDEPSVTTEKIVRSSQVIDDGISVKQVKVDDLMGEMFDTFYESHLNSRDIKNRFRRHRKHNKNRRRNIRDSVLSNNQASLTISEKFRGRKIDSHLDIDEVVNVRPKLKSWMYSDENKSSNMFVYKGRSPKGHSSNGQSSVSAIENSKQGLEKNKAFPSAILVAGSVFGVEASPRGHSTPNDSVFIDNGSSLESAESSIFEVPYRKTDSTKKVRRQIGKAEATDKITSADTQDAQLSKQVAVVRKCCPSGQNITDHLINGTRGCAPTFLTFQPLFYEMYNSSHMTLHTSNLFETIVGYPPCRNGRYRLDPRKYENDKFFLFTNGSIYVPLRVPSLLGPNDFCMDTFWNSSNPAGVTLPLACFQDDTQAAGPYAPLIMYSIGLLISIPFLVATTLAYVVTPELREAHGLALASHCGCLAAAFACLAATQLAGQQFSDHACTVIAYIIQFSFVSCFFWLNVMCYNTWLNVRDLSSATSRGTERRRFVVYSAYAWLVPLSLVLISVFTEYSPAVPNTYAKPESGVVGCQLESDKGALPYFYAPVGCILLANVVIFIMTSRAFSEQLPYLERLSIADLTRPELADDSLRLSDPTSASDATSSPSDESPVTNKYNNFKHRWKKYKKIFRMCCLLSILLGLSSVMEVVSWLSGTSATWSVFDVLNALQGVVIFSIFVAMKPYRDIIWRTLRQKYFCLRHKPDSFTETMTERTIIRADLKRERVYV